jgi:hypothetical protein
MNKCLETGMGTFLKVQRFAAQQILKSAALCASALQC